jgi:hypothetical protein
MDDMLSIQAMERALMVLKSFGKIMEMKVAVFRV